MLTCEWIQSWILFVQYVRRLEHKEEITNRNDAIYRGSGSLSESRNISSDKVQEPFLCGKVIATVAHRCRFIRRFGE